MKTKLSGKKVVSYLILLIMLGFLVWYTVKNPDILQKLTSVNASEVAILSVLSIVVMYINGFRAKVLTEIFTDHKLRVREWLGLSTINTLGNYSPFQGGFVARGYYLKNYFHVPYIHFASSIVASTIITLSTFSYTSVALIGLNYFLTGTFFLVPFLAFLAIGTGGITLVALLPLLKKINFPKNFIGKHVYSFIDGWDIFKSSKNCVSKLVMIDLAILLVSAARFWYAAQVLQIGISFLKSIIITSTAIITVLVNITPGAIGIREAIAGFTATLVGASLYNTVLAATLERAVNLFWTVAFGIPFSIYFARYLNKKKS